MARKSGIKITGQKQLMRNLNKQIEWMMDDERRALDDATKFIKAEAVNLAPVEFGVLRNSAFQGVFRRGKNRIIGRVGFTAKYAGYVHEMPMLNRGKARTGASPEGKARKGVYWGDGENKFLEKAMNRNALTIRRIIKNRLKR